ncbi:MAG: serine hydrolase domain-containing protein [Kiloniellales bacterium]
MDPAAGGAPYVGASVAIVRPGEDAWLKGYGHADAAQSVMVDPTATRFRLGSVSKWFTATAVVQLIDAGRIGLQDPVNDHLTRFQLPEPFGVPVTVEQLLTHRGGFEENHINTSTDRVYELPVSREIVEGVLPQAVRPPGGPVVYSNFGVSVLGALIEDVTGLTYGDYLRQRIFEPLGMSGSGVGYQPGLPDAHAEPALIYQDGRVRETDYYPKHPFFAASGGVYSTAADMALFMRAQLEAGEGGFSQRLMSSEGYRLLQTGRAANAKLPTFPAIASLVMERTYGGVRTLSHAGNVQTFRSVMILVPDRAIGIFISVSGDNPLFSWRDFAVQLAGQPGVGRVLLPFPLAMEVMAYTLGEEAAPSEAMPFVPAAAASDLERFVGDYRPAQRSIGTIEIPFVFREAVRVGIADDGTLRIGGRDGFREIAPLAFARPGLDRMAAFVEEDGEIVAFATAYPRFYERVSGLASPRVLQIWHLGFGLLCLLGLFAVRWPRGGAAARLAPWFSGAAGVAAIGLFVWPYVGLGLASQEVLTEPGVGVFVWAAIGNAVWLFGGAAFLLALACWVPGMAPWRLWQRLAVTAVGAAGLAVAVSSVQMGFWGIRVAGYL